MAIFGFVGAGAAYFARPRSFVSSRQSQKRRRCRVSVVQAAWRPAGYLREAVEIKKVQVQLAEETIFERPDHPVSVRMSFYASEPQSRFTRAVRRDDNRIAVIASLKRFQPRPDVTKPERIADIDSLGNTSRVLEVAGADAFIVNTDAMKYGLETPDITTVAKAVAKTNQDRGVPIAMLDLIINPIQIAEAAVAGACAVIIVAAAALDNLGELLDAATAMGIEAVVECHTTLERDLAIECGATLLMLTNRDRTTNRLCPGRAEVLRKDIPGWVVCIGGGGLTSARDAWSLLDDGFDGVVLGEALLQSPRPEGYIEEIKSQQRPKNPFQLDLDAKH